EVPNSGKKSTAKGSPDPWPPTPRGGAPAASIPPGRLLATKNGRPAVGSFLEPGDGYDPRMTVRGEAAAVVPGVTPREVFDFVLDPAQYTKADTKIVWVTKLADTHDGMLAREDGRFLGRFPGSVITRYRWQAPGRIDVTLEHGVPRALH